MRDYILRRLLYAILTIWAIATITFVLMNLAPGSPFAQEGNISPKAIEAMNAYYGLDEPIFVQYLNYLKSIVTFDYGPSMKNVSINVNDLIVRGLPITMTLGVSALIISVFLGSVLGIVAALNHNKHLDYLASMIALLGVSVPSFIFARFLIQIFSVNMGVTPVSGWGTPEHMILPVISLAVMPTAQITRLTRSAMLEVLSQDYMKTAKAKGVTKFNVIWKHGVRNAMLPVVTVLGIIAANLLTGSFVIEKVYSIPGIGQEFVKSITNRDYPIIMAMTILYSFILVLFTLLVDISYVYIDPRIRITGGKKRGKSKDDE